MGVHCDDDSWCRTPCAVADQLRARKAALLIEILSARRAEWRECPQSCGCRRRRRNGMKMLSADVATCRGGVARFVRCRDVEKNQLIQRLPDHRTFACSTGRLHRAGRRSHALRTRPYFDVQARDKALANIFSCSLLRGKRVDQGQPPLIERHARSQRLRPAPGC